MALSQVLTISSTPKVLWDELPEVGSSEGRCEPGFSPFRRYMVTMRAFPAGLAGLEVAIKCPTIGKIIHLCAILCLPWPLGLTTPIYK